MKPTQRPRSKQPARALSDILPAVGQRLNLDQKVSEWSVLSLWPQIVEDRFIDVTQAVKIKTQKNRTILVVQVSHATLATEMMFYTQTYCDKLNAYAPQTGIVVDRIEIKVG